MYKRKAVMDHAVAAEDAPLPVALL